MEFIREKNGLKIKIDEKDRQFLAGIKDENKGLNSDDALVEFMEPFLCNSEWEWVYPEEVGALTDAPLIGIRCSEAEEEKTGHIYYTEVYGFMDYQVKSLLQELWDNNEAFLQKG